jgi:Flp pilus assembly protein TadG
MMFVQSSAASDLPVDEPRRSRPLLRRSALFARFVNRRSTTSSRLGAAATEFAIVAPLFILLVIGMIELGRGLMVQQVLINASRVGARQAITMGATSSEVQAAVTDYAASVAVPNVSVDVTPNPASSPAGTMMSVTTTVPFSDVSWLPAPWFLGGTTLTAESTMRKEGFE